MKKNPFHDPIAPTERKDGKQPWSFKCPTKDQAHSGNLSLGDNYGSGFRTPVGTEKVSNKSPIPQKSACYMASDIINEER